MKLRRFNEKGIAAVRELLPQIRVVDDLARAEALVSAEDLIEPIPALADIDLDASRVFPTTFAFCEYFHSLMKDHKPLTYRTDVGFWTWLAMVYVRQLARIDGDVVDMGEQALALYSIKNHRTIYRHKFAYPYALYLANVDDLSRCQFLLLSKLNSLSEMYVQFASRQYIVQNKAVLCALRDLYFDPSTLDLKKGSGGKDGGSPRRFAAFYDQISMTRDFVGIEDSKELLKVLPPEFDRFKTIR